ncbi:LysR family transcriptional regulator [Pseudomonas sp. DCB_AW]|uniref:LysR family transcriptional regulator n=1 Tax=unclassified Pseudomonas TaxID=196821 RepID=UPI0022499EE4|nr:MULTISPECIES: LysR family transcriptional regulator [unclassified Pseudomonas]MCX2689317.1 LysR family transcriptional regulator [Pseudomonas sp. DCB_AW]GLO59480.1 LysR family transcriptional regulator [Pseudomonas putida]
MPAVITPEVEVMPTRHIDLQDHRLRYLHLSHDKGSMRAAAEALGVATSSVSRQIARLEEELGIELVRPGTHRISLTAAGEAAVDYYIERIRQHALLVDRLDELRSRQQASTVIAIGEGLLGARAINSLQGFLHAHNAHKAEIISAPSLEVQRMVMNDEAHLGVVFAPNASARLTRLFSLAQPLRMIVHRDSRMAERSTVSLAEVARESLVLPGANFRVRELADAACKDQPFAIVPTLTSNSLAVILDFVRSGLGATLLAELPIIDELKNGTFKALAIDCEAMNATDIQIVTRRGRTLDGMSRELATEMAKAVRMAL